MRIAHPFNRHVCAALLSFVAWSYASAADVSSQELTQTVSAADTRIHFAGRWDTRDQAGPRCTWSGCSATIRFNGVRLNAKIQATGNNWFEVFVDSNRTETLAVSAGWATYRVADNLPPGEHTVMLVRRTEAHTGNTQIGGWQLDATAKILRAEAPSRSLLFIGDSITCGYGNEAPNKETHFSPAQENAAATYGFLAAQALHADYSAVAWSGKKLWPNNSILDLFDRTLALDSSSKWDPKSAPAPDAILINLGTNDFGGKPTPEEAGWVGAYIKLIKSLREQYPKARIYCAEGTMMNDFWPADVKAQSTCRSYIKRAVAECGDSNVTAIWFSAKQPEDGLGADWHPSLKTHQRMADVLTAALRADLKW